MLPTAEELAIHNVASMKHFESFEYPRRRVVATASMSWLEQLAQRMDADAFLFRATQQEPLTGS